MFLLNVNVTVTLGAQLFTQHHCLIWQHSEGIMALKWRMVFFLTLVNKIALQFCILCQRLSFLFSTSYFLTKYFYSLCWFEVRACDTQNRCPKIKHDWMSKNNIISVLTVIKRISKNVSKEMYLWLYLYSISIFILSCAY